jgi:hypothetical protein
MKIIALLEEIENSKKITKGLTAPQKVSGGSASRLTRSLSTRRFKKPSSKSPPRKKNRVKKSGAKRVVKKSGPKRAKKSGRKRAKKSGPKRVVKKISPKKRGAKKK